MLLIINTHPNHFKTQTSAARVTLSTDVNICLTLHISSVQ